MTKQQQHENYSLQRKLVQQKPVTKTKLPRDVYKVIIKKKKEYLNINSLTQTEVRTLAGWGGGKGKEREKSVPSSQFVVN